MTLCNLYPSSLLLVQPHLAPHFQAAADLLSSARDWFVFSRFYTVELYSMYFFFLASNHLIIILRLIHVVVQ